jgi:ferrochelatase
MASERPGLLLAQLGTPDAPTPPALRRYLAAFLADRRVVDLNPILWWLLLHGVILRTRPRRSAALYARVWTPEGSPLLVTSRAQQRGVAARLEGEAVVDLGMRYGNPSIASALDRLATAGCRRIVVLPLFPQYAGATTASVYDAVAAWMAGRRDVPAFTFVRSFAAHPAWIASLAATVRAAGVAPTPQAPLLFSFHGLPQRHADTGDPYPQECAATARAAALALGLADGAWQVVYQSRFGREPWLRPSLDETLTALGARGVRTVAVATPSFVADCLETIDEVGRESLHAFQRSGGQRFVRVPCPNDRPDLLDALAAVAREHLALAPRA